MKKELRKFIEYSISSDYRHHSFTMERAISDYFLKGKGDKSLGEILNLKTYADILAPDRLRASKNALICLVTVMSRSAINDGADAEISFSMSDFFINEIERLQTAPSLENLLSEIISSFRELVNDAQHQKYSFHVARAIQYIRGHIYDSCNISDVASFSGCSTQYLSSLFQKELNLTPKQYVRQQKLQEARILLSNHYYSVQEIASLLGYCSSSHFITDFKSAYGMTPKQFTKKVQE